MSLVCNFDISKRGEADHHHLGIGIRTSIYVQAFMALLTGVMRLSRRCRSSSVEWVAYESSVEELAFLAGSVFSTLITGISLVVASFIQASMLGLTVYHGVIVLELSLITVFTAIIPYAAVVNHFVCART